MGEVLSPAGSFRVPFFAPSRCSSPRGLHGREVSASTERRRRAWACGYPRDNWAASGWLPDVCKTEVTGVSVMLNRARLGRFHSGNNKQTNETPKPNSPVEAAFNQLHLNRRQIIILRTALILYLILGSESQFQTIHQVGVIFLSFFPQLLARPGDDGPLGRCVQDPGKH